jgi:hypothetical protein
MAELIIFVDTAFGGLHTHIFDSTPQFSKLALGGVDSGINGNWQNKVSSFVVVSGVWQFFKDENFQSEQGKNIGPGQYPSVTAEGIANDSLSSVKLVSA